VKGILNAVGEAVVKQVGICRWWRQQRRESAPTGFKHELGRQSLTLK